MHKTNILILTLFVLIIPLSTAQDAEIKIFKEEYKNFETLQGELIINNIQLSKDITLSNLKFTDNNLYNIAVSKNLIKVNSSYYLFYFNIPSLSNGSYNIIFLDIFYIKDGIAMKENFEKKIHVNSENAAMSIKPGYYFTKLKYYEEAKFSLTVKSNLGLSQNIEVISDDIIVPSTKKFILSPGQAKTIEVNSKIYSKQGEYFNTALQIKYENGNYSLPILILRDRAETILNTTNQTNITGNASQIINNKTTSLENAITVTDNYGSKLDIKIKIRKELAYSANITINNNLNVSLKNLTVTFTNGISSVMSSNPDNILELKPKEKTQVTIDINKNKNLDKNYTGELVVKSKEGAEARISVELIAVYTEKAPPEATKNETITPVKIYRKEIDNKKENRTAFWIVVAITFLLFLIIMFIIYAKGKPKQREFEKFIEESRRRQ
ncbi:MAG TPA: hypothetical protein VJG30_02445 [Candidatus Nanoarchaeia archaeon]|nr:hypothetical protein [Candidatus Nanoarchaeia archaeon]